MYVNLSTFGGKKSPQSAKKQRKKRLRLVLEIDRRYYDENVRKPVSDLRIGCIRTKKCV